MFWTWSIELIDLNHNHDWRHIKGLSTKIRALKGTVQPISFLSTHLYVIPQLTSTALQSTNGGHFEFETMCIKFFLVKQQLCDWNVICGHPSELLIATESLSQWVNLRVRFMTEYADHSVNRFTKRISPKWQFVHKSDIAISLLNEPAREIERIQYVPHTRICLQKRTRFMNYCVHLTVLTCNWTEKNNKLHSSKLLLLLSLERKKSYEGEWVSC